MSNGVDCKAVVHRYCYCKPLLHLFRSGETTLFIKRHYNEVILIRDALKWGREEVSSAPNSVSVLWSKFNQHCSTKEKNKDLISVICFKMLNDYLCAQSARARSCLAGRQIRNAHTHKEAWFQLISAAIDMFGHCRYQRLIFFPLRFNLSRSERPDFLNLIHHVLVSPDFFLVILLSLSMPWSEFSPVEVWH